MATVIDALVMTLGLDTKGLKRGEREAADTNRRLRDEADKTRKAYELSGARIAQSITSARNAALGFLAVTTAGAGLSGLIRDATTTSAAMGRMARDLGVSTQALSAWERVSQQVGNSAGELTESFAAIQNQIQQFRLLGNAGISPAFRRLGIQLTDASGNVRSNEDIFRDAIRALNARPAQERETIAGALGLPGRAAANLAAVPNGQLDAMLAEQRRNGGVTPEQAAAAQQRQAAWLRFQNALTDTANRLLTDFTPAIVFALDKLRDFATYLAGPTFRPVFEALSTAMRRLASYLGSQEFLDDVQLFITAVRDMTNSMLEWLRWLGIIPRQAAAATPDGEGPPVRGPDGSMNWTLDHNGQMIPRTAPALVPRPDGVGGAAVAGAGMGGAAATLGATANQQAAFAFFQSRGWSREQAAAIVGNTMGETEGLDVNAFNGAGGGRGAMGIGQWRGPRIAAFEAQYRHSPLGAPLSEQLAFMDWELRNTHRAVGDALSRTTDAREGADLLHRRYSIPGAEDRSGPRRQANALRVLQQGQAPPATPATPPSAEAQAAGLGVRIPRTMSPAEAAAAAQGVRIPAADPGLVTGPEGATMRDSVQNNQTSSNENHIGAITVMSQASDAGGIAQDIGAAIRRYTFAEQSTRGLA